jgi:hypothetical protein
MFGIHVAGEDNRPGLGVKRGVDCWQTRVGGLSVLSRRSGYVPNAAGANSPGVAMNGGNLAEDAGIGALVWRI